MVVVPGAVMVEVTSARELLATFEKVCFPTWPVLTNSHDTPSIQEKNEDSALQMRMGDAGWQLRASACAGAHHLGAFKLHNRPCMPVLGNARFAVLL